VVDKRKLYYRERNQFAAQ